ncbi:MAG TPA: hypothetical protein VIY29_11350, partial [Ktedonobacteraceae bacterium]
DVSMALLIEYLPTLSDYADYQQQGLGLLLTRGADLGFLRPSSRIRIQTPDPGKARKRSPKKSQPKPENALKSPSKKPQPTPENALKSPSKKPPSKKSAS